MAKEYRITAEVSKALDALDWNSLRSSHITRADVEANPQAACQLAEGRATTVRVSYRIPGIPEVQEAQLVTRRFIDQQSGGSVLDPRIIVRKIDRGYELREDNIVIAGLYDDQGRNYRLDPEKSEEKAIIDYLMPKVEKGRDGKERTYTCSICPVPLTVKYRSGKETKSYIGWDPTSNRPVHRSADSLRAALLTEDGRSRLKEPLFGKGIRVDDDMASAMAQGRIVAAFGEVDGRKFATALSFNIARGQVTEDRSRMAEGVRQTAYEYLRRQGKGEDTAMGRKNGESEEAGVKQTEDSTRRRGVRRTI